MPIPLGRHNTPGLLLWAGLLVCLNSTALRAEFIYLDTGQPLSWEEMLQCELVVVAKYQAHDERLLDLEVLEVFRGTDLKPGDRWRVSLQSFYSIQTKSSLGEGRFDALPEGVPRLCFGTQLNGRALVPVPVVPDVRGPAVYFIPKAADPALTRFGQVQSPLLRDGWRQTLRGAPMDLLFRLIQDVSPAVRRDALEELHETRNPAVLRRLLWWSLNPPPVPTFYPSSMLAQVGRGHRDVYDLAWNWMTAEDLGPTRGLQWVALATGGGSPVSVLGTIAVPAPFPETINRFSSSQSPC